MQADTPGSPKGVRGGRKSSLALLPDPYADDGQFELFDPRGLSAKPRRPSIVSSGAVDTHPIVATGTGTGQENGASKEPAERLASTTPPANSHSGHSGTENILDDVQMMSPTSQTPPSALMSPFAMNDSPMTDVEPPRGRSATLNHLRIGSGGELPPPDQQEDWQRVMTPVSLSDQSFASNNHRAREPSESSSVTSGQSRAASFLSSFSPPSPFPSIDASFSRIAAPDEQGFEIEGFTLGREIGHGGFGIVREAYNQSSGEHVAVKIVRHVPGPDDDQSSQLAKLDTLRRGGSLRVPRHLVERQRSVTSPVAQSPMSNLSASMHDIGSSDHDPAASTASRLLLQKEITIWQQLKPHPHILPLIRVVHTNDFSYIFMPLCSSNLYTFVVDRSGGRRKSTPGRPSLIGSLSPPPKPRGLPLLLAREIFAQVVDGLYALHNEAGITHRDIKLENILQDQTGAWRIADFGLAETSERKARSRSRSRSRARQAHHRDEHAASTLARTMSLNRTTDVGPQSTQPAGSLPYSSPEQMRSAINLRSFAVDIWALGCVVYALVSGILPFRDDFEPRLRMKILEANWDVPESLVVAADANEEDPTTIEKRQVLDVLRGCLEKDDKKRWTISQVRSSPWLASISAANESPVTLPPPMMQAQATRGRSGRRSNVNGESTPGGLATLHSRTPSTHSITPAQSHTSSRRNSGSHSESPSGLGTGSGSGSGSGSGTGRTRKERSTSRGPFAHYAVDRRTKAAEMKEHERDERMHRWDRESRESKSNSRSRSRSTSVSARPSSQSQASGEATTSRGRTKNREDGRSLTRVTEPY